jgi:hypothetical protein
VVSKPAKVERWNACAEMIVEAPSPQPTSATLAAEHSLSSRPSKAGSQSLTRCAA